MDDRTEGLVHVPQPSWAMSFPRHIALTSKHTGISLPRPSVWLLCGSHAEQVLLGQNGSPFTYPHGSPAAGAQSFVLCWQQRESRVSSAALCHVRLFVLKSTRCFGHSKMPEGLKMIINKSRATRWRWLCFARTWKQGQSFNMTLQQVSHSTSSKCIMFWSQNFPRIRES